MKFVDFNDKALECISKEQWQDLAKLETARSRNVAFDSDEEYEVTIVCLSYDDGVRYEGNPKPCRARKVLYKDLINCHYAEILYDANGFWLLNLNIERSLFPSDMAKFKTKEDAINAARLCKNAQSVVDAGEIIAREFPEFATEILNYVDYISHKLGVIV